MEISYATVHRWVHRYLDTGGVEPKAGSARPRVTDVVEDIEMIIMAEENPFVSRRQIAGRSFIYLLCCSF